MASFYDISSQKETEETLLRNKDQLNRAQEVAHIGSWYLNLRENRLEWSDQVFRIFGLPLGTSMTYEDFLTMVHPGDVEYVNASWQAALSGASYDIEHRIIVNGEIRWVHEKAELVFALDGQALHGIGTVQDITDRKLTQIALEESELLYKDLFENSASGIFISDRKHRITRANPEALHLLGYSQEEILGMSAFDLIHPEDQKTTEIIGSEQLGQNQIVAVERRFLHKNGHYLPVAVRLKKLAVVSTYANHIVQFFDNSLNVTVQEELRRHKDEAERANAMKSKFLAAMSHDIRTPMNSILGMTDLALLSADPVEQLDYLTTIKEAGHHLLMIVNDILDISKIEAGALTLENRCFYLKKSLQKLHRTFAPAISKKGVAFHLHFDQELPEIIRADETRLTQILSNLISNAQKFTFKGSISLEVRLLLPERQKNDFDYITARLRFQVRDTGVGIAKEKQSLIFQKFQQADISISRKYGGTGLGLAICRELATMMNGTVWVESELGYGSAFFVEVDVEIHKKIFDTGASLTDILQACEKAVTGEDHFSEERELVKTEALHILLVEDNPVNQKLARTVLERHRHHVVTADDGLEAIEQIHRSAQKFDLILVDLEMPRLNGWQTTREIRNGACGDEYIHIPIIAMSAHADVSTQKLCEQEKMTGYISKPIDIIQFQKNIAKILSLR